MHFLPTKEMKNAALRREELCELLIKQGMSEELKEAFCELFLREGEIYRSEFSDFYEIEKLTEAIFCAAVFYNALKGKLVFCRMEGGGVFKINRRFFEIAVLSLSSAARNGSVLSLILQKDYAKISLSSTEFRSENIAVSSLGGVLLREIKSGKCAMFLPLTAAEGKPQKIRTEHLFGRYSVASFFIL